jgi:hypothetical protein
MATVVDPYDFFSSGNNWGGATGEAPASSGDDTLIYKRGSDVVDGLTGYDVLVIPFAKSDSIIGTYSNNSVSIAIDYVFIKSTISPEYDSRITMNLTAVNVEQLQFTDGLVTLQERPAAPAPVPAVETGYQAKSPIGIDWGSSGFWTRNRRYRGSENTWLQRGARKSRQYLVDSDVKYIEGFNPDLNSLSLSGGSWGSVGSVGGFGGTILYSGKNVLAFIDGFNSGRIGEITLS